MSQMEEHEFYSGLIIKIGARYFFCNQEGALQGGLSVVLGGIQEPESSKTQVGVSSGAEPEN